MDRGRFGRTWRYFDTRHTRCIALTHKQTLIGWLRYYRVSNVGIGCFKRHGIEPVNNPRRVGPV